MPIQAVGWSKSRERRLPINSPWGDPSYAAGHGRLSLSGKQLIHLERHFLLEDVIGSGGQFVR